MDAFDDLLRKAAASRVNGMIVGAPGSQREDIARRIHRMSARAAAPMVEIDCTQPDHAFHMSLPKILETANRGTLLLVGIDALSLGAQGPLMGAVETWEVVSAGRTVDIDVRYIATATQNLRAEAQASRFRYDLFCKLTAFTITVPETSR
jgi:DNA-binding NtrC family response regulator